MYFNTIAITLLVSLANANLVPQLRVVPGYNGNVEGWASATSLAGVPSAQIPAAVDAATLQAYNEATTQLLGGDRTNIMAGLYVPAKQKIYFATTPRGQLCNAIKANPAHYHLTAAEAHPMAHSEQYAYSLALADGASPGLGSYISAHGAIRSKFGSGTFPCNECCPAKCEPWADALKIGNNGVMYTPLVRSNAPSPEARGHKRRRVVDVPEEMIF